MANMNRYFRTLIETGEFELGDIDDRITAVFGSGKLTPEEYGELIALAQSKANPSASLAPIEDRFDIILEKVAELKALCEALSARVEALENGADTDTTPATGGSGDGAEEPTEPSGGQDEPYDPTAGIPEWAQPLGAHDAYKHGDRVKYNGRIYESTLLIANVWSPDAYPSGWTDVTSEYEMMSYGNDTTRENDTSSDNTDTTDAASGNEPDSGVSDSSGDADTNETDE